VSTTDPPARNEHHSRGSDERSRATAMSVISRPPLVSPGSNGARTMRSSPSSALRGPLLAVCGLCGGAGASTLAYLTALAAARRDDRAVLVADTGGPTAGISHYAGLRSPRSLTEAAEHINAGLPTGELIATTADGLRVLATSPTLTRTCSRDGVELLLAHARERYTLTVIDCGTLAREADQIAVGRATHVVWVLPATAGAAIRGRQLLDAITPHQSGREILVARHEPRDRRIALRELRDLARLRRALLILLPSVPELATGNADAALETAQVPLQAILGALSR
jgi:cellulose biosynthesis protein BcsQ